MDGAKKGLRAQLFSYAFANADAALRDLFVLIEHELDQDGCTEALEALRRAVSDFQDVSSVVKRRKGPRVLEIVAAMHVGGALPYTALHDASEKARVAAQSCKPLFSPFALPVSQSPPLSSLSLPYFQPPPCS